MFGLKRRAVIALGAVGMLTLAGVSTAALAATPTPTAGTQKTNYQQVFSSKLAAALGIDQTKLTSAVKQAESDTIDQAVANGDLTKSRADEMKQRLAQDGQGFLGPFGGLGFPGERGGRGGPGGPGGVGLNNQAVESAIAAKLGMTVTDLQTQLRSGTSLLDLARSKNVSEADLRAAIKAALKTDLDKAVTAGKITQAQEDQMLARVDTMPLTGGRQPGPAMFGLHDQAVQDAIAAKLGMTTQDMQTQLRSGKTVLDLAKAKGVSETDLRAAIKAALKTQLDKAVSDGKLTQAQEDQMLARVDTMSLDFGGRAAPAGQRPARGTWQ